MPASFSIVDRARAAIEAFRRPAPHSRRPRLRAYAGAAASRLTADWLTPSTSADAEVRSSLRRLLDRSRALARDNDYVKGFLLSAHRNINGAHRFDLRCDAGEFIASRSPSTPPRWQSDHVANRIIEAAWTEWCRRENCTVNRRHNWRDVRRLAVRTTISDGNMLIRRITGDLARNRFNFALQLWEVDHLATDLHVTPGRGRNEIRFGVEFGPMGDVVAYHLHARHPGDTSFGLTSQPIRIAAAEVYHCAILDRAEQTLGVPWTTAALTRLRQLGAFEEAAVVAARLGASKAGFFKNTTGQGTYDGDRDADGRLQMDVEPGTFEELPHGYDLATWSPEYPNVDTGDFRKAMLRGICSSLGVSYTTLGNDLESVNFSSARVGLFDEREGWKDLQLFFAENLWEPIFSDWLEAALMSGALAPLPHEKMAKFNRPIFKARRWPFIDPLKDIQAAKTGIALRTTSRRQVIEEQGGDVEEVFHDNLADEQLAEAIDLSLTPPDPEPEAFGETTPDGDGDAPAQAPPAKSAPARAIP